MQTPSLGEQPEVSLVGRNSSYRNILELLQLMSSTVNACFMCRPSHVSPHMHILTDIEVLHEREDWRMHTEEGGIVTSLPILFENMVVEVLITLKEIVVDPHSQVMDRLNEELLDNSRQHFSALLEVRLYNSTWALREVQYCKHIFVTWFWAIHCSLHWDLECLDCVNCPRPH